MGRRLCTIACFYRYAEQEGLLSVSPAVHVRRNRECAANSADSSIVDQMAFTTLTGSAWQATPTEKGGTSV